MKLAGIYIHIPFCAVKCMYCDFYSIAEKEDSIPRFINALNTEIERCNIDSNNWKFDTIFIGGGTPSIIEANFLESIITSLSNKYDLSEVKEFTIEANPGEAPKQRLKDYHSMGINRLSIGVQSLEPSLLKFLTRIHNKEQFFETYKNARSVGFDNINFDLIYSIPGQSWDIWERDLNKIIDLDPEHISAYTLTMEKGTDLFQMVKNGQVQMPQDSQTGEWFTRTHEILNSNGICTYEVSNFSKAGMECQHNIHYWRIHPYLAFGPSAHGFNGSSRWNNTRSLDQYIQQIESGKSPVSISEVLTKKDNLNEYIGFGLRMVEGIDLDEFSGTYKSDFIKNYYSAKLKWEEYFNEDQNTISLTRKGMLFSDLIIPELLL
jgi:oxygen-independent coproporphyrinogen-3 oxidase|tara:strand:+ start:10217 stop:11347 length:1131 start_codon:yes stop_codon:yes gene_type:complete